MYWLMTWWPMPQLGKKGKRGEAASLMEKMEGGDEWPLFPTPHSNSPSSWERIGTINIFTPSAQPAYNSLPPFAFNLPVMRTFLLIATLTLFSFQLSSANVSSVSKSCVAFWCAVPFAKCLASSGCSDSLGCFMNCAGQPRQELCENTCAVRDSWILFLFSLLPPSLNEMKDGFEIGKSPSLCWKIPVFSSRLILVSILGQWTLRKIDRLSNYQKMRFIYSRVLWSSARDLCQAFLKYKY